MVGVAERTPVSGGGAPPEIVDPMKTVRDQIVAEINEINNERDATLQAIKRNALLTRLVNEFLMRGNDAQAVKNAVSQVKGLALPGHVEGKGKLVQSVMTQMFEVIKTRLFTPDTLRNVARVLRETGATQQANFLEKLLPNVEDPDSVQVLLALANKGVEDTTAPFFHDLINRLAHPDDAERLKIEISQPGQDPTKFERYYQELSEKNRHAATVLGDVIKEVAVAQGAIKGVGKDIIREKFNAQELTPDEMVDRRDRGMISDSQKVDKIRDMINVDIASAGADKTSEIYRTADRARRMIENLEDVQKFARFYEEEFRLERGNNMNPTEAELRAIGQRVARNFQNSVLYVVNTIYRNVLNDNNEPSKQFTQAAGEAEDPYFNPNILYRFFTNRLVTLKSSSAREIGKQTTPFYTFKRNIVERFDAELQQDVKSYAITADLEKSDINQFLAELEAISETELNMLEYGYNFRLITLQGTQSADQRLFAGIAEYARNKATTDSFDRIKVLQDSDIITAAQTSLMTNLFSMIAKKGHVKSRELSEELFTREGTLLAKVAEEVSRNYSHIDTWRRTRAIRHAITRVYGSEFMYQLAMSYADAPTGFQGEEDIGGRNSVFSWQEQAMRWGFHYRSHDFNIKGAVFMPHEGEIDNYTAGHLADHGFKIWQEMYKYGHAACFDDEHYWKRDKKGKISVIVPEIATPGNVTETGGPNAMGGWRVRRPLIPLIQNYLERDERNDISIKWSEPGVLTKIWKSVENSGVNNIRVLMNADFLDTEITKKFDSVETQYEDLMKFLYRRYFSQGVGKSFLSAGMTEDSFWQKIKDDISKIPAEGPKRERDGKKVAAVLKPYMFNAMTTIVYERTPLEFFYKSKRRDEQNGITTWTELKEEYFEGADQHEQEHREGEWDEANDNLQYVQMEARRAITKEVNQRRKAENWGGDPNNPNVYGDLDSDFSKVRNNKGYVIDADFIKELLVKRFLGFDRKRNADDPAVLQNLMAEYDALPANDPTKLKVEHTIKLHRDLQTVLMKKPKKSRLEEEWEEHGDQEKLQAMDAWKIKRINWFSKQWQNNAYGGIPFLLDKTWDWETEALSDKNAISRCAIAVAVAAEEIVKRRTDRGSDDMFIVLAKDTVRKGPEMWRKFKSYTSGLKKILGDEIDSDLVTKIGRQEVRRFILLMIREDSARNLIGEVHGHLLKRNRDSLAAQSWTNFIAKDFGASEVRSFLKVLVGDGALKPEEAEKLAEEFDASWVDVFREVSPKVGFVLFAIILATYLKQSYEKEVEGK